MKKTLGRKIFDARTSKGWTQQDLATASGYSAQHISNIETGRTIPCSRCLMVLSATMRVKLIKEA